MGRLLLFPEPLPDESLYSVAVRYHRIVVNESYRRTSRELFGTYSRTCGSVLPCCLGPLSRQLDGQYSVADLIESLTLLPLYRPFIRQEYFEAAVRCMEGTLGTGLKMGLGITASGLLKYASFRYCEACVEHDVSHFGVPYWHRIHMAAGVCVCPHHGNVLISAKFPDGSDWRQMILPGETDSAPVLNGQSLGALQSVAELQFWGLEHPQDVRDLVKHDFLRWRLAEMGMLLRGRLKERDLRSYIEQRLRVSTQEAEYLEVVGSSDWAIRLLHRRGGAIQPFRYYFLCWLLDSTQERMRNFVHEVRPAVGRIISPASAGIRPAEESDIAGHRQEFMCDCNERCHDKAGYYWLYSHDREWLRSYIRSHASIKARRARVNWTARDMALSREIMSARSELMSGKGKPRKVTKSALARRVSNSDAFLRNSSKFPESTKALNDALESEHDFQLRKVVWVLEKFPCSKSYSLSSIMRLAGVRIRKISDEEVYGLIRLKF